MADVSGYSQRHRALCQLAQEAAQVMGKPKGEEIVTLELTDGDVVEGRLYSMTIDKSIPRDDANPSNLVLHIRLNDVASIRETYGQLQAEVAKLRREGEALSAALKRAVALVPPVAAADLRRVYREARGSYK